MKKGAAGVDVPALLLFWAPPKQKGGDLLAEAGPPPLLEYELLFYYTGDGRVWQGGGGGFLGALQNLCQWRAWENSGLLGWTDLMPWGGRTADLLDERIGCR